MCVTLCVCVCARTTPWKWGGASELPSSRVAESCELWAVVAGSQTQLPLKSCVSFLMLSHPSCPLVQVLMLVWRLVTSTLIFYSVVFWVPDVMVIYIFNHIYLLSLSLCMYMCVYMCFVFSHVCVAVRGRGEVGSLLLYWTQGLNSGLLA